MAPHCGHARYHHEPAQLSAIPRRLDHYFGAVSYSGLLRFGSWNEGAIQANAAAPTSPAAATNGIPDHGQRREAENRFD